MVSIKVTNTYEEDSYTNIMIASVESMTEMTQTTSTKALEYTKSNTPAGAISSPPGEK